MSVVIISMACLFLWNSSFNALLEMLIVVMCLKFLQLYLTCDSHVYQAKLEVEVWFIICLAKKSSSKLRQSHKLTLFNFFLKNLFSLRAHRDGLSMYCFVFETYLSANLSKESRVLISQVQCNDGLWYHRQCSFFVQIVCGDFLGFVIPCSYEMVQTFISKTLLGGFASWCKFANPKKRAKRAKPHSADVLTLNVSMFVCQTCKTSEACETCKMR